MSICIRIYKEETAAADSLSSVSKALCYSAGSHQKHWMIPVLIEMLSNEEDGES